MELYLIRHSLAEAVGENNGFKDEQRALTEDGLKRAEKVGKGLRKMDVSFEVVLTSPAKRCVQTTEAMLRGMRLPENGYTRSPELSMYAEIEELFALLNNEYDKAASVALFGHQPQLSDIASALLSDGGYVGLKISRAGVLCLQTGPLVAVSSASLLWKMLPGQLVKMGG